jgi:hypothetical protein
MWLLIILAGMAILKYRYQIYDFTGEWGWAEKYVGNTTVAISLIGMLLIAVGTAYPFWVVDISPQGSGPQGFGLQWATK